MYKSSPTLAIETQAPIVTSFKESLSAIPYIIVLELQRLVSEQPILELQRLVSELPILELQRLVLELNHFIRLFVSKNDPRFLISP